MRDLYPPQPPKAVCIGYWRSEGDRETKGYPKPVADSATPQQVEAQLRRLDRLTRDAKEVAYRGWSTCRICGQHNGSREYETRAYRIPSGLRHYIEDHAVLVPGLLEAKTYPRRNDNDDDES